ncbi:phenylalanine--tRNA ligase alpha subunit isoform X2 [Rhodnius prolixus]|uniref:phenylalanine--tRNA ligase alpha subunit isoform X2 n=1 Tax=Rhodnius prolixus TaxID=13249 RepID=UPI003D189EBC
MTDNYDKNIEKVIDILHNKESITSIELSRILELSHNTVIGIINSLKAKGNVIKIEPSTCVSWELTDEGNDIVENGSYEVLIHSYIAKNGPTPLADVMKNVPNSKIGFSKAMANGWVKKGASAVITKVVDTVTDDVKVSLELIKNKKYNGVPQEKKNEFKKRKLIKESSVTVFKVLKGEEFGMSLKKLETELTPEMIESESWRGLEFKSYNLDAKGVRPFHGSLHPLMKVRDEIRSIFLAMGFSEMNTGNYVESSFWNFDALFQPQQHPARDAHDTFFLTKPATAVSLPKCGIVDRVEEVYRNETLDTTHLAEFHQVEGIVADYGISLGHLIGVINDFFCRMGLPRVRFKPAYNPYTEPSMEIFCYHIGLGKWIEVGNSGMFRPEMLRSLGLPPGVAVLGWGLSLERPAMIKFGFDNIRELVGPRVSLRTIHDNPMCRFNT